MKRAAALFLALSLVGCAYFSVAPKTPRQDYAAVLSGYTAAAQSVADWEKANPGDHTKIHEIAGEAQAVIDQVDQAEKAGTITDAQFAAAKAALQSKIDSLKAETKGGVK